MEKTNNQILDTNFVIVKILNWEKTYLYCNRRSLQLKIDDFVIVPVRDDKIVGTVVGGYDELPEFQCKPVIAKIDLNTCELVKG